NGLRDRDELWMQRTIELLDRLQRTEVAFCGSEACLRGDVTGEGQHRVVRRVVGAKEGVHVLEGRRVQVLHRADRRMVVRVVLREHRRVEVDEGGAIGLV